MAAAPFVGTLQLENVRSKNRKSVYVTFSDVVAAGGVFPDGGTSLQMPADSEYDIIDLQLITGGTDTSSMDVFVNNLNTGVTVVNKANLNTNQYRQFIVSPMRIRAASTLKLIQRA